ncbi:MAG: LTA synthase family protein [Saprospiraceae bacterium]
MYRRIRNLLPQPLWFLSIAAWIILGLFLASRIGMVAYNAANYHVSDWVILVRAFLLGMWFDFIVACYMLFPPFAVLAYCYYLNLNNEKLFRLVRIYCSFIIVIVVFAIGVDIPYFNFFNSRLNVAVIPRIENLYFAVSFLLKEPQYYPFALVFLFAVWGLNKVIQSVWLLSKRMNSRLFSEHHRNFVFGSTALILVSMMFLRPSESSMRAAYFTNDPFVNQVVLNPVFTYADSYYNEFLFEKEVADSVAVQYFQNLYKIKGPNRYLSPIARNISFEKQGKPNVVFILMESMSAEKMSWFTGQDTSLTPFLDKLTKKSLFFPNFYSWGIHTYNGIFSSLYGMPYNMLEHPMKNSKKTDQFYGIASVLRDQGYQTSFFCTHDKAFDNIVNFIPGNGFQKLYDVNSYPTEKQVNDWGVGDETLYDFAISKMDSLHKSKKPFFFTLLSNSNHPPFTFPAFSKCKPTAKEPRDRGFQYADWALKNMFSVMEKKPWFKNTVFVLVGDHGVNTPSPWDITMTYNHVPCYFYSNKLIAPKINPKLGLQIDILPTLMHILKIPYVCNSLGCDLLSGQRPYVVFSQDHKLCILNHKNVLIRRKGGTTSLYNVFPGRRDTINIIGSRRTLADSMIEYGSAMLKLTKMMITNDWLMKQSLVVDKRKKPVEVKK